MITLFIEALIRAVVAICTYLAMEKMLDVNTIQPYILIGYTMFSTHILLELLGANSTYCKKGYACRNDDSK
jgi:hypothetical protein